MEKFVDSIKPRELSRAFACKKSHFDLTRTVGRKGHEGRPARARRDVILLYREAMMTVFRCWLARFKNTPRARTIMVTRPL